MPSNFTTDDETRVAGIQSTISTLQGLISDITSQNSSVGIKSYIRETDLNCVISGCEIVKITGTMKVGIQAGSDPLSVAYVQGTRFAPENKITASNYGVIVPPTTSDYQRHIVCLNGNGGIQLVTSAPAADYDYDSAFTKDLLPLYLLHVPANTTLNIDSVSVTLTDIRQYYSRGIRLPSYQYPAGKTFTLTQTHGAYGAGLYLKTVSGWETILTPISGPVTVPQGGTGLSSVTSGRLLYGAGTDPIASSANLTFTGGSILRVAGYIYQDAGWIGCTNVAYNSGNYSGLFLRNDGDESIFTTVSQGSGWLRDFVWKTHNSSNSVVERMRLSTVGLLTVWGGVSTTTLTLTHALTVPNGGTGATSLTGYLKGNGTSAFTASATVPVGDISGTLSVPNGGTGLATIPAGRILYGNNTSAIATSANLTYDGTNLGIGTTTPLSKLHVAGLISSFGANQGFISVGAGTNLTNYEALSIAHDGANGARFITSGVGSGTIRPFNWITWNGSSATHLMTLTPAGNLGLGTTTPAAWSGFKALQISNCSVAALPGQIDLSVNSFYDGSNYRYINTGGSARYTQTTAGHYWILDASGTAGDLAPISCKMALVGNNLGIGTTTPLSKLHVNGLVTQWGNNEGFLAVGYGSNLTNYEGLTCSHSGVSGARFITSGVGSGTIRPFNWITWNGSSATHLMTLTPAGDLGIGTTTPLSKLHVNGGQVTQWGYQQGFAAVGVGTDFTNYESLTCCHAGANGAQFISSGVGTGTIRAFNWITWDGSNAPLLMTLTAGGYLGIGTTSPSARLHVLSITEQLRLGYNSSNYATFGVSSTGGINISSIGISPYFVFSGDSSSTSIESIVSNTNGNARGAVSAYSTQNTIRGYIGALKHGSSGYVLFTDETTDGFGIRAQTVLEFGISATGIGRWNTTGLAIGGLFNPSAALHVRKTTEQLRLGYDASKYTTITTDSSGNTTITPTGPIASIKGLALMGNGLCIGAASPTISVSSDQTIQIAGGGSIEGIIHVVANGSSGRHQKVTLLVSAHQFDYSPIVQVLSNHSYLGLAHMMTNFRFQYQSGGDGLRYLVCDIGNRGGQTITIYAMGVGVSAGYNVQLKLTPDTASPMATIYGINVQRTGFVAFNKQTTSYPIEVGTTASDGNGAYLSVTGNWTNGSDLSKKWDIANLCYGLDEINSLRATSFKYNNSEEIQFGVIAQELREVMPELVEGLEGNLSVKTTQLIFPLIRAVQQLSARVVELEAR